MLFLNLFGFTHRERLQEEKNKKFFKSLFHLSIFKYFILYSQVNST
jgi:hypothetical protein